MKCVLPLLFLFACSAPVHAGVRYTLHLQTDEGGKHSEIIQNAWIQGSQAKLLFAEDFTPEYEIDADRYGANAYSVDSAHRASHLELPRHNDRAPIHIENLVTTKT